MRLFLRLGTATMVLVALAPACGSDDDAKRAPHPAQGGEHAGGEHAGGEHAGGERAGGGAEPSVGGEPAAGGAGGSGAQAGAAGAPTERAGAGGASQAGNAGESTLGGGTLGGAEAGGSGGSDAGGSGGQAGEGALLGNVLYASFGTKLVWIEPDTAALHEVGDMRSAAGDVTYSEVVLAYGGVPGRALIVTPRYDATANQPPPALGEIDLCTGIVTDLNTLTRTTPALTAVEGLARHPNGTWYLSTGSSPPGALQYVTNKLSTVNVTTFVVTDLPGTVDSVQDDLDSMVFVGDVLYGIDVATTSSRHDLLTASLTTGSVTVVGSPAASAATATPLRIAYDDERELAYSWRESDRNLLTMSLASGVVTAVGPTHAANVYPGQVTQGFTVAPSCP